MNATVKHESALPNRAGEDDSQHTGAGWWIATGAFTLTLMVLLSPLLRHVVDPIWDAYDFFFPAFGYLSDSIREGRWPLWDPFTNCGYPYHADPSNFTLNPLAMLIGLLIDSPSYGLILFWFCNWWWGGIGMLRLARYFGAEPAGGFAAAITYALSGFFLAHSEHISFILVAAWLPWVITYADQAVQRPSIAHALLAGVCLGICTYGGYPGLILFACLALAIWLMLRYLPAAETVVPPTPLSRRILWIATTLGIVAVIFSVAWSPVLNAFIIEGRGYTERVNQLGVDRATMTFPFTFTAAFSLFFPYATFVGRSWMDTDISMSNGYMGILALPLAFHWVRGNGIRRTWWLVAFVLFMFVVSLGGKYGLRTLLYYVYPPTRFMQYNAPFRLFWILPLCLAAGLGLSRLVRHPGEQREFLKTLLFWGGVTICAAGAFTARAAVFNTSLAHDGFRLFAPAAIILVSGVVLLWVVTTRAVPSRFAVWGLALILLVDMALHLISNSGTVWDTGGRTKYVESFQQRSTATTGDPVPRIPGRPYGYLNAQQILKKPLVQGYLTMLSEDFDKTLCESRFAEIMSAPYRFWLTPGGESAPSREYALQTLAATGNDSPVPVFVDEQTLPLSPARSFPGTFGAVHVDRYAPERIDMNVSVPTSSGAVLASTERYTPGWKAYVDGVPQPVRKINLFFRGIFVPPGQHTIVWRYEPERWNLLIMASYLTIVSAIIAAIVLLRRK